MGTVKLILSLGVALSALTCRRGPSKSGMTVSITPLAARIGEKGTQVKEKGPMRLENLVNMPQICENGQNRKPFDTGLKMPPAHGVETAVDECPICGNSESICTGYHPPAWSVDMLFPQSQPGNIEILIVLREIRDILKQRETE